MSPAPWTGGVQGIPDKNDILDMYVHVRRAGPNTTDSLWMFGGISLDNTTGNRYFDFEMYQTDIYYDRASAKFYGYGPDAGHTSWKFDAAGNIITPGDIIFSGEFQSGTLTKIEARIWVKKTDWQTVVPTAFNWRASLTVTVLVQYMVMPVFHQIHQALFTLVLEVLIIHGRDLLVSYYRTIALPLQIPALLPTLIVNTQPINL